MRLLAKRETRIARRIRGIEKELSSLDTRIRTLSRRVEKSGDAAVYAAMRAGSRNRESVSVSGAIYEGDRGADARLEREPAVERPGARGGPAPRCTSDAWTFPPTAVPQPKQRPPAKDEEQFANYFMSGGLKRTTEPLRYERNVQRAKALFLLLFFVLALFAVLYFRIRS